MSDTINYNKIRSVLFVCMGNICRSPTAEAVFKHKIAQAKLAIEIDSAGTIGAHAREKPDHRAVRVGSGRGYSFDKIRARKVTAKDFDKFDLILAMDNDNVNGLMAIAPSHLQYKIELFLDYAYNHPEKEVPDPYYGGPRGFELVLDLIEDASDGLIQKLTLAN